MISALILIFVLVLIAIGMPVAFAIGIPGAAYFLLPSTFLPDQTAVQRIVAVSQSFPLLAVPLFILLGNLMNGLGAQGGPQAWAAMRDRGAQWLGQVAALERVTRSDGAPRPSPRAACGAGGAAGVQSSPPSRGVGDRSFREPAEVRDLARDDAGGGVASDKRR